MCIVIFYRILLGNISNKCRVSTTKFRLITSKDKIVLHHKVSLIVHFVPIFSELELNKLSLYFLSLYLLLIVFHNTC